MTLVNDIIRPATLGVQDPITGGSTPTKTRTGSSDVNSGLEKTVDRLIDRAVKGVDVITDLPNEGRKKMDSLTDFFIRKGKDLERRATGKAVENLTESKAQSLTGKFTSWAMRGNNKFVLIGGAVIAVILMVRGLK